MSTMPLPGRLDGARRSSRLRHPARVRHADGTRRSEKLDEFPVDSCFIPMSTPCTRNSSQHSDKRSIVAESTAKSVHFATYR